jgi:acyl-CoA thioester hydrolase
MGVVYHANYLVWMEIGRVEFVRSAGCNYKDLEETEGLLLGVIDVHCRYIYPARYDQEIVVETEITKSTSRIVEFAYAIRSAEPDRLLFEGSTKHIWLSRDMRPKRLPRRYEEQLRAVLSATNA